MSKLIHPLLMLIAQATEKDLVLYIEYLKTENRLLRSKLPKRIGRGIARRYSASQVPGAASIGVRYYFGPCRILTARHPVGSETTFH